MKGSKTGLYPNLDLIQVRVQVLLLVRISYWSTSLANIYAANFVYVLIELCKVGNFIPLAIHMVENQWSLLNDKGLHLY